MKKCDRCNADGRFQYVRNREISGRKVTLCYACNESLSDVLYELQGELDIEFNGRRAEAFEKWMVDEKV